MDERNLLLRLSEGNDQAFAKIFDQFWEKIFVYVMRVLKDKEDSMDVVQDTMAALWLQRAQLSDVKNLKAYLFSIAHYKALHKIKNNVKYQNSLDAMGAYLGGVYDEFETSYNARELEAFIDREIQNLPKKMREVFSLSRKDLFSHKQIAEKLSISENTVKKQVNYAIKHIKNRLKEYYFLIDLLFMFSLYSNVNSFLYFFY